MFLEPEIPKGYIFTIINTHPRIKADQPFMKNQDLFSVAIYDVEQEQIGFAKVCTNLFNNPVVGIVDIKCGHKRKGLGTILYDYVEHNLELELSPSEDLEDEGVIFWKKRVERKRKVNPSAYSDINTAELK